MTKLMNKYFYIYRTLGKIMKISPKILFKYSIAKSTEKILFTGIQPTGSLHIGNYFGSVFNVLKFQ